jgi:hypothetical protein
MVRQNSRTAYGKKGVKLVHPGQEHVCLAEGKRLGGVHSMTRPSDHLDPLTTSHAFFPYRVPFDAFLIPPVQKRAACFVIWPAGFPSWTKGHVLVPKWDRRGDASKRRILSLCSVAMRQGNKPVTGQFMSQARGRELRQITSSHTADGSAKLWYNCYQF